MVSTLMEMDVDELRAALEVDEGPPIGRVADRAVADAIGLLCPALVRES